MAVFETGRGGDITFDGPGQLVGYPIFDLRPDRCDVHLYVRDIEEVLIISLGDSGSRAGVKGPDRRVGRARRPRRKNRGHWRADQPLDYEPWLCVERFYNLKHFQLIVPCGIADRGVTSIERLFGRAVPMAAVEDAVRRFADLSRNSV